MKRIICISFLLLLLGCQPEKYKDVGDISYDKNLDKTTFELCDESLIKQYYIRKSNDIAPSYQGEKRGLEQEILSKFYYPSKEDQNGYITIRFIVNCHGQSGRFRLEEMNFEFERIRFESDLSKQLLNIVKGLNRWSPRMMGERKIDFYQYLTFKIESGQINKILP